MNAHSAAKPVDQDRETIRELVTDASVQAINLALAQHRIPASQIVGVLREQAAGAGVGDTKALYRVLYRG